MFTFCATNECPDVNCFLEEVEDIPHDMWHYDAFRNCYILPLWNPGGQSDVVDITKNSEFKFTEAAMLCPELISYVKPLCEMTQGRLTVLKTLPNMEMNVHLDSKAEEVGTEQFKWRMVLKGERNGLFFLDKDENKVFPNNNHACYVMDGAHPHAIESSKTEKITVCIGSPWRGDPMIEGLMEPVTISRPELRSSWCP